MASRIRRYPSAAAYVASCVTKDGQPRRAPGADNASTTPADVDWDDGLGWDGAVQACRIGHSGYAHKIAQAVERIRVLLPDLDQPGRAWDAYPSTPEWSLDIATHLAGDPEPFVTYPPQRPQAPVRLLVGNGATMDITAQTLINRGAALCAVASVLRERGVEVIVDCVRAASSGMGGSGESVGAVFTLPDDAHSWAWWLAHPAAARRIGFAWIEAHEPDTSQAYYGVTAEDLDTIPGDYAVRLPGIKGRHGGKNPQEIWFETEESSAKHAADLIETLFQRATANT